ncbi:restriction endonuclease BglII [Planomicrobium soli]|uniref:Restriction endonuclease BglII n=1 Tax=Planomicrobium soli TaxID=1176648 RepID=A0A2P8GQM1_9BACL|nr:hypothetical protein [Planomicrobium soli]PSL36235.1 restriction endonuclease BglII [Planomicrobium soli]
MTMNAIQAKTWASRKSGDLKIVEQEYFRHANAFLDNHPYIRKQMENSLNVTLLNQDFSSKERKTKTRSYYKRRLKTPALNKAIRRSLKTSFTDMKYELTFEEGVFYDSSKSGGFDFGLYDVSYNVTSFWNYCYGRRPIFDGPARWNKELGKRNRNEWKLAAYSLKLDPSKLSSGENQIHKKSKPTVIGEIQFGNWGLVYRDILKTIKIEHAENVDLLIYVTAAGNLATYISSSTVNFKSTKKIFEDFQNVLSTPIWLIGVDIC